MRLLTLILMFSIVIGDTLPSGHFQYYFEDEAPAESSLRALRGAEPRPAVSPPPPPQLSRSSDPHRNSWWFPERLYSKRRQNVAYYNLNSFGLRYGKRQQDVPAGFTGQQDPVK